jgi:hypothetical protein
MSGGRVMPEPIERARMALAEIGITDPSAVRPSGTSEYSTLNRFVSDEVAWRTAEVTFANATPICWACWHTTGCNAATCQATRRFERDCGVSR